MCQITVPWFKRNQSFLFLFVCTILLALTLFHLVTEFTGPLDDAVVTGNAITWPHSEKSSVVFFQARLWNISGCEGHGQSLPNEQHCLYVRCWSPQRWPQHCRRTDQVEHCAVFLLNAFFFFYHEHCNFTNFCSVTISVLSDHGEFDRVKFQFWKTRWQDCSVCKNYCQTSVVCLLFYQLLETQVLGFGTILLVFHREKQDRRRGTRKDHDEWREELETTTTRWREELEWKQRRERHF